jgi:Tol biopolymer transport system component
MARAQASAESNLTTPGTAVGTVAYMSPEQVRGTELDVRTDLFSFGAVLYEMCTGRLPFPGETKEAMFDAILNRAPVLPVRINPGTPPKLEEIIHKALEKDRDVRCQTAAEIRADLKRLKRDTESSKQVRPPEAASSRAKWIKRREWLIWAPLLAVPLAAGVAYWRGVRPLRPSPPPETTLRRLTNNPGLTRSAAISPDGTLVAYVRNDDIWVQQVDGGGVIRVTDDPADGLLLAVADKTDPDGPFGIFLISIKTGERHRVTAPPSSTIGDTGPAFSPDGRTLAFRRTVAAGVNDIYVVPVAGGEPKRLTFDGTFTAGLAWTPDGRELIFSSSLAGIDGLWRVSASGGNARRIRSVGQGAYYVSVSRRGHSLAYSRWFADTNIWRLAIGASAATPEMLISSTWEERSAQYSPDGTRIAFRSDRSGNNEIWVCDASGSNPLQLTSFGGPLTGTPRWSPDGKNLAFDSRPEGDSVVYTISALGGMPHRITPNGSNGAVPSWSHDGKWIYFASRRGDGFQVWKIPVKGQLSDGDPLQVTRNGGFAAFESVDGQLVYYSKGHDVPGLWVVPANGGEEKPVISDFKVGFWGYWAVVARGIYFLAPLPPTRAGVNFYNFDTRSSKLIAVLPNEPPFDDSGFAVSPDEGWILYTHVDNSGSDIMLVENFR